VRPSHIVIVEILKCNIDCLPQNNIIIDGLEFLDNE